MKTKFLGYEARIIYDDYSSHEVLIPNLEELNEICKSLENRDDTFEIEYKKKYILENGEFLYSKKEHISIDNPNTPQRELYLGAFDVLTQSISMDDDVKDEDLQKCSDILEKLLNKPTIKISELTLLASFRYALGRQTYIVSEVVEDILSNWEKLSKKLKNNIQEEIKEALKNNNAGSQIDIEQWKRILDKVLTRAIKSEI